MDRLARYLVAATIGLMISLAAKAQDIFGTIKGEDDQPLEFVNVMLYDAKDTTLVQGTVTDKDGNFIFHDCVPQIYLLRASMVGFVTLEQRVDKDRVGTLIMKEDSQLLSEVTVKGQRPQYKLMGGGVNVDIQHSVLSDLGNAMDVLGQLPRVNVENDAVSIFAKGTPLIYINNRLVRDMNELKRLKSADIKDVDVITNPGAQYGAHVESVIKIHTVKASGDGFSFRTEDQGRFNSNRFGGYTEEYVKFRNKGLEVFGTGLFNSGLFYETQTLETNIYAGDHMRINSNDDAKVRVNNANFNAGFNYDFSPYHSVGADYSYGTITHYDANNILMTEEVYRNDVFEDLLHVKMAKSEKPTNHDVNAYYVGKINELSIDANLSYHNGKSTETVETIEQSQTSDSRQVNTISESRGKLWAGKIVLSYPVWKGKLNFGHEITSSNSVCHYDNPQHLVASANNEIKESNVAVFAEYGLSLGHWSMNAGLRYEHVKSDYYSESVWQEAESRNYRNIFPNASLSWQNDGTSVQLSYTCKTDRPDYSRLSNNVQYDNRYLYEGGNPYLQPCISQNLELMAVRGWWNLSAGYSYMKDGFQYILGLYQNKPIAFGVYRNFDSAKKFYASLVLSPKFGCYQPQFEVDYSHQRLDATKYNVEENMSKGGFKFKFRNTLCLPHDLSLFLSLNGMTEQYFWLVRVKPAFFADARIVKSFWNKRLTLNLAAHDIFHTWRQKTDILGNHVNISKNVDQYLTDISLTVTFQLNTTSSRYKGTGAGQAEKDRL